MLSAARSGAPRYQPTRDFRGRDGYDSDFLGVDIPLPKVDPERAAPLLKDPTQHELKYTHFSVIMDKERRQPLVTAENINGASHQEIERTNDDWCFDSRMAREYQLGNEAYSDNTLDRSHMVRRSDVGWGKHARMANNDTFVYTNCAPQSEELNRNSWAELESSILTEAIDEKEKRTVFTGPIFQPDDPLFDNHGKMDVPTQLPRKFFKVVVSPDLEVEGYIVSPHTTRRASLSRIEELTRLDFGELADR